MKEILISLALSAICFSLRGQNVISKNDLGGIWSDKGFLDSLSSHNSITKAFKEQGELYNGLHIRNDTLILALYPNAMEEDWLYFDSREKQFKNSRGYIKITDVIGSSVIRAEVNFDGKTETKYFIKVMPEQEAARTSDALQLHFQRLYRIWFANEYAVMDSSKMIDSFLFTEQGNAEGYIDNSLFTFIIWSEDTVILNLENWKTNDKTYYILTYKDSMFLLDQVKEPEWSERPKPLTLYDKRIILRRKP